MDAKSQAIQNVETIYENDSTLLAELGFLKSHLVSLKGAIENLESRTLPLVDSTTVVCETFEKIRRIPNFDRRILQKSTIEKNAGLSIVAAIAKCTTGLNDLQPPEILDLEFFPFEMASFKNASITSVDVERSFSK